MNMTPKQAVDIDEEKLGDELARVAAYPIERWAEAVDKFKDEYLSPLLANQSRISFREGVEAGGVQMAAEIVKVPCPKCGGCGQYMIDVKCDCRPQPTEQKECPDSDHLNHKDCPTKREWAMEAIRAANAEQAKVMGQKECIHKSKTCGCGLPQPTDGLLNGWEKRLLALWPEDVEIDKRSFPVIRTLLAEQKKKTREDTIDEVLRALELNDDHEVPKIVIKALKSKKQ